MKVRHKVHHSNQHTVLEESSSYYICDLAPQPPSCHTMLSKAEYEPVPTEHWQDVTGECEVGDAGIFVKHRRDVPVRITPAGEDIGYRLRKVQVNLNHYRDEQQCAFLVERKVIE